MNHPFVQQPAQRILYLILWSVIISGHIMILLASGKTGFMEAIVDGLIYNLLLMIFSIAPWYMMNSMGNKYGTKALLTNILIPGVVLLSFWLLIAYQLLAVLIPNAQYQTFANDALPYRIIYGLLIYTIIIMIYMLINTMRDIQLKNQRMNELNSLVRDAEMNALKAQINPHFLFNSLNSIASLTIFDPSKARDMVIKLSEYMRYVIRRNEKELMTLDDEMANINRYLDIEMTRFGDRIEIQHKLQPDCHKALIPNMVLQPVFENAVKHGVHESQETIRIFTRCLITNQELVMVVANTFDPDSQPAHGKGIGLENIRRRLMLQYNRSDLLQYGKVGNLFTVVLTIPQNNAHHEQKN